MPNLKATINNNILVITDDDTFYLKFDMSKLNTSTTVSGGIKSSMSSLPSTVGIKNFGTMF